LTKKVDKVEKVTINRIKMDYHFIF